ncbi:MAG: NADPH-dependent FMN reductase [Phenylobacterium sp.]|uniref:NADPH-dependent FMN reductase n=1 Tax=Phenylobacterium sp. TaxID=1871053 RepID=UPI00271BFC23|nr:NADPH-dependent FMN reductase [Phenylobacterium sp.]MDO8323626.1 NADPH-dependent FMN reductase [Phenylobacterium sp.]MDO8914385.1 NADPH-dependent FMN reductase [Phenylobacterium sp.]MDP2010142.1 NADPH-dependent FMN reductase [Phenylobacterium sp.]MDP3102205.1 NADPH-dependent FMN reductase [Phenylobacterium sp.]MDP3633534.1 NADPH-dependent FMN reductase [Phenylobacterium sp.]
MGSLARKPLIVGIGGTIRSNSSTEKALKVALAAVEAGGGETRLLGGEFLASLPIYNPQPGGPTPEQQVLIDAVRDADGVIVASPGYHGSISGVVKNALDTLEGLRDDARPYFTGRAVGCVITAEGWQAAGTTLTTLRSIIHALRGWPTPFGAALNANSGSFDAEGACVDPKDAWQLATVGEQVLEFALLKAAR